MHKPRSPPRRTFSCLDRESRARISCESSSEALIKFGRSLRRADQRAQTSTIGSRSSDGSPPRRLEWFDGPLTCLSGLSLGIDLMAATLSTSAPLPRELTLRWSCVASVDLSRPGAPPD